MHIFSSQPVVYHRLYVGIICDVVYDIFLEERLRGPAIDFTLPLAPGFSDWQPCPGNSASRRANIPSDRENTSIDAECVELPSGTCLRLLLRNTVLLVWVSSGRGLG